MLSEEYFGKENAEFEAPVAKPSVPDPYWRRKAKDGSSRCSGDQRPKGGIKQRIHQRMEPECFNSEL